MWLLLAVLGGLLAAVVIYFAVRLALKNWSNPIDNNEKLQAWLKERIDKA